MKVLVTGSEGFIGRNLVSELEASGHKVVSFDTKFHRPGDLFEIVDFRKIDHIFHLGAISSTQESNWNVLNEYNVNFSIALFEEAITFKKPITFTSSASVFGNTMKGERHYNPLNFYATSKMLVEMWIYDNYSRFKPFISVPRLFNVYGKDERKDDMATSPICKFKQQALTDKCITVFKGSEDMVRDFICVEDVVDALINNCLYFTKDGFFDVGTSKPISFLEVAQLCSEKYDVPIRFIDMPKNMHNRYQYYTCASETVFPLVTSVDKWLRREARY